MKKGLLLLVLFCACKAPANKDYYKDGMEGIEAVYLAKNDSFVAGALLIADNSIKKMKDDSLKTKLEIAYSNAYYYVKDKFPKAYTEVALLKQDDPPPAPAPPEIDTNVVK